MSLLDRAPRMDETQASRLARELYGVDGAVRPLPSERDQNFLLDTPTGRFVLKLANAADSRELLEAQHAALGHLAARGSRAPRVVRTRAGDEIARDAQGHLVRLVTWLPGEPLGTVRHQPAGLLEDLGRTLGEMDRALADFDHPALHRTFHWDLAGAVERSRRALPLVNDRAWRDTIAAALEGLERRLTPRLDALRRSIVHNDANDHNVLVETRSDGRQRISGVIDYGDMVHSYTAAEPAVAIAYVLLHTRDPLGAASRVLAAYHRAYPLLEEEIGAVFDLIQLRMCLSATVAARQQPERPGDGYLGISQEGIRAALPALMAIHPRFAEAALRHACGLPALPRSARVTAWLSGAGRQALNPSIVGDGAEPTIGLDLGVASPLVSGDPDRNREPALTRRIRRYMEDAGASIAVGGYLEPRILPDRGSAPDPGSVACGGPAPRAAPSRGAPCAPRPFCSSPAHEDGVPVASRTTGSTSPLVAAPETGRRTVHLGLDYFAAPGTPVRAALPGVVHAFADNAAPLDYGPVVILRHTTGEREEFFTLYGHLTRASLAALTRGATVRAGDRLGALGTPAENGGWTPHLHFQVIVDLLDMGCDFPGVCRAAETSTWAEFSPDPNVIAGLPPSILPPRAPGGAPALDARTAHTGGNVRLSYHQPVEAARGWMQYLYDRDGRRLLDGYNNVPHVGHCHPAVVEAAERQLRTLNTNTRYLHDSLAHFADALAATLPAPLDVCYFVNSGSEANELALRLARAHTRARDVIVLDAAYHGITTTLIGLSSSKFDGPGGDGRPPWVHAARLPDVYRGPFREDDAQAGRKYADDVSERIREAASQGRRIAAFLAESCPSVAGQILPPVGYLERAYAHVRETGGVCIADEVQTAYGRVGTHFYAFEAQGVVPDIVVLGKPIGNGYPLGAVVTTREIARSFDNGMEFFSTFGGSTVSCAAGLAVLDVVRREALQAHAARVGGMLLEKLRALAARHEAIGDVRGSGLFLGVELVEERSARSPAAALAAHVVNRLRDEGVLIGTDGPDHNVLKIRPPMPFAEADAEELAAVLDAVLAEIPPSH